MEKKLAPAEKKARTLAIKKEEKHTRYVLELISYEVHKYRDSDDDYGEWVRVLDIEKLAKILARIIPPATT